MKETDRKDERRLDVDRTLRLKWKDISEAELRATLESVKGGSDPAASMKLIEYFYRQIHDNQSYDQTILLAFLDHIFGEILDGRQPDHVLGFKQRNATE